MRLDKKLLLIAPAIVLAFVVAGMVYTAAELHVLARSSDTLAARKAFVDQVARGEKPLDQRQAVNILQVALDVEENEAPPSSPAAISSWSFPRSRSSPGPFW